MNIFAQDGYGPSDKLTRVLDQELASGVILSPRYSRPEKMAMRVAELKGQSRTILMDPEYFATEVMSKPNANCGALEEWEYFRRPPRTRLISGNGISDVIRKTVREQSQTGLDEFIAPNLFIRQADSIDTAIAINFLNETKAAASEESDGSVYGTLAIHRDAILSGDHFFEILDDLTGMESPPDGYYLVLGSSEQNSSGKFIRSDLSHARVIAAWMYANYVLSINGANVINGYCFLLAPLIGVCGAHAAASGWSSGLRKFCFDRYLRAVSSGGRAPNTRYLSAPLMAHIKQTDIEVFEAVQPGIRNNRSLDRAFDTDVSRTDEALQMWEGLEQLSNSIRFTGDIGSDLKLFGELIVDARSRWITIQSSGISSEVEPNLERLRAMEEGISLFMQWAELPL